jgi:hypothetical protein
LFSTTAYISFFYDYLSDEDWLYVEQYARILVPDTFLYKSISDQEGLLGVIGGSEVKNSLGPALIWWFSGSSWYAVACFNAILVLLIIILMEKLGASMGVGRKNVRMAALIFVFAPSSILYSVGALKELPNALLLLALAYSLVNRKIFMFVVVSFVLILFRYQLIFPIVFIVLLLMFSRKSIYVKVVASVLFLGMIYPFLSSIDVLSYDVSIRYREQYGGGGLGGYFESLRNEVPILSVVGVLVRTFQSMFEPIISFVFRGSLLESGLLSMYGLAQLVTNIIVFPFIMVFVWKSMRMLLFWQRVNVRMQIIYSFCVLLVVLIGGFSFIHHRYLYPVLPLMIVCSLIPMTRRVAHKMGETSCPSARQPGLSTVSS